MNKIAKTGILFTLLLTALAACDDDKKETKATIENPSAQQAANKGTTTDLDEREMNATDSSEDTLPDGKLSYREKSKHDKYYISTNEANFYEDNDSINGTAQFLTVSVRLENTFDEGDVVSLNDLHFTLEDTTANKSYEPTGREAYTKDGTTIRTTDYSNKALKNGPMDITLVFNIPQKDKHSYQLLAVQDSTDADVFKLDNIKTAK
ncbi:hypothetical protein CN918_28190 [Priestia megaterium]|nr:hypothetical protein CN918_28190 [Priestia megaterium]